MKTFECPKCREVVEARATEVWHRCKEFKSKMVKWEEKE